MASSLLAEISPAPIRGLITGTSIVLVDAAAILAQGINMAMSRIHDKTSYEIPFGLSIAFGVVLFICIASIDESPTFYLSKDQEEKASKALRRIRRGYQDSEIRSEMALLQAQAALRQDEENVPWIDLFKGTNLRRTLLGLSIANFQQMSGIAFATNYVIVFLSSIGGNISPFTLGLATATLAFVGAIVGLLVVDLMGRRTLALSSFIALFLINLVIGIMGFLPLTNPAVPKVIAAFCCMFAFFFAVGFGPLTYIVAAEIPTARLRNKSTSFTFFTVACFSTVVLYVLPYISNKDSGNLGPKTYLIFAGWMAFVVVATYLWLPETKGRSPAELDEMFELRIPARDFKGYVCSVAVAVEEMKMKLEDTMDDKDHLETKGAAVTIEKA